MIDISYFTDTRCIWYCYRYFSLYVNDKLMPVKYIFGGIFIHKTRVPVPSIQSSTVLMYILRRYMIFKLTKQVPYNGNNGIASIKKFTLSACRIVKSFRIFKKVYSKSFFTSVLCLCLGEPPKGFFG